jgi:hypothetical protein
VFAELRGLAPSDVALGADFFTIGGDSFRAGRCVGALRGAFALPLQVADLYQHRSVAAMARMLHVAATEHGLHQTTSGRLQHADGAATNVVLEPARQPFSPCAPAALAVQALPLAIFIPCLRICTWILFTFFLSVLDTNILPNVSNIVKGVFLLVLAGIVANIARKLVLPLLGIAVKWAVIGRYREGDYPTYGQYYLRWWLVDQSLRIAGFGFFKWHK